MMGEMPRQRRAKMPRQLRVLSAALLALAVLFAHIYAGALAAKGFPVRVLPDLGTRELVDPALMNGLIQVVPEYTGSALAFLSLGRLAATSNAAATYRSLARSAERRDLVAAQPAPAQDANAIVVTAATAARYHLRSIADLRKVAPGLVFGGPPECRERADCLLGLKRIYGLRFKSFVATDTGGLQPAENITPLIRRSTMERYGPRLLATLNAVSARLTTATLRYLNGRVQLAGMNPRTVASGWPPAQALIASR